MIPALKSLSRLVEEEARNKEAQTLKLSKEQTKALKRVHREGLLLKKRDFFGWSTLFCVVDHGQLSLYNNPTDKKPKEIINLMKCVARVGEKVKREKEKSIFSFSLTQGYDRVMFFASHSEEDAIQWIKFINHGAKVALKNQTTGKKATNDNQEAEKIAPRQSITRRGSMTPPLPPSRRQSSTITSSSSSPNLTTKLLDDEFVQRVKRPDYNRYLNAAEGRDSESTASAGSSFSSPGQILFLSEMLHTDDSDDTLSSGSVNELRESFESFSFRGVSFSSTLNEELELELCVQESEKAVTWLAEEGENMNIWSLFGEEGDLLCYDRQSMVGKSTLCKGTVFHPCRALWKAITDSSLKSTWDPNVDSCHILKQVDKHYCLRYMRLKFPDSGTLVDFVTVMHWRVGADGSVIIVEKDVSFHDYSEQPECVRGKDFMQAWLLRPKLNNAATEVSYMTSINLRGVCQERELNYFYVDLCFTPNRIARLLDQSPNRDDTLYLVSNDDEAFTEQLTDRKSQLLRSATI